MNDGAMTGLMETSEGITSMTIRGAGKIARAASQALKELAIHWEGEDRNEFLEDLRKGAQQLHSTRPSAVSLRNGILLTLMGAETEKGIEDTRRAAAPPGVSWCR